MNCVIDLGHTGHHVEWIMYFLNKDVHIFTSELNRDTLERFKPSNVTYVSQHVSEEEFIEKFKIKLSLYESIYFLHLDLMFSFLLKRAFNPVPLNSIEKKLGGLWLRNNFFYNRISLLGQFKYLLMISLIAIWSFRSRGFKVFLLNEQIVVKLQALLGAKAIRFSVDPVDLDKLNTKDQTEVESVLLFGSHDKRKGTDVALEELSRIHYKGKIIVAGSIKNMSNLVHLMNKLENKLNLERHLTFVSDSLMHELFRRADIILLPYVDFGGSSGVLSWGVAYNKVIIGSKFGLIGKRLAEYEHGYTLAKITDLSKILKNINGKQENKMRSDEMLSLYHSKESFVNQFIYEG